MLQARPRRTALDRVWIAGVAGLLLALGLVALRLVTHSGPPVFILPEHKFVDESVAPSELLPLGDSGYDGQFVWRLAQDPFTTRATDDGVRIDLPPYRQQRILLPLLAHLVPFGTTTQVLVGINVLAVIGACLAGAALARRGGHHALWGLLAGFSPTVLIGLARTLNEPLATALVLAALVVWLRGDRLVPALLLTLAALARETTLAAVVGMGVVALGRRDRHAVLACLLPGGVELLWQLHLWQVWGELPWTAGGANLGTPVVGPLGDVLGRHRTEGFKVYAYEFFRLGVLFAIAVSASATRVPAYLRGMALGSGALALSLGAWEKDVAFIRATSEVWTAAVVISLATPAGRMTTWFRGFAVLASVFAAYRFTVGLAQ